MPVETILNELATEESFASFKDVLEAKSFTRFCYGTFKPESPVRIYLPSGTVNFPMSTQDADRLVTAGENAPFGKGRMSVLDPKVRQAMHVKEFGTSFELAETAIMQEIESHLLPELQNSQFRLVAKRDKMNLYCQGGFFKAHQDTPKAANMVATLVIIFPSEFEGGEFVLADPKQKEDIVLPLLTKDKPQYIAFYSDVLHEILPVKSGMRVSLAYSLYKEDVPETAKSLSCVDLPLHWQLSQLLKNPGWLPEGGLLGYHCTSKYVNIGQDGKYVVETCLKGSDMAFWSVAKSLGLQPEILPIWENPHHGHHDCNYSEDEEEEEEEDEDEDEDKDADKDEDEDDEDKDEDEDIGNGERKKVSKWARQKRDQEFIISDQWNLTYEKYHEGYDTPNNLHLPEKEGYDFDKIAWCNSQDPCVRELGQLGLSFAAVIPDTYMGNQPATEDMQFYNMAGIFCKVSPAFERCATDHVPMMNKRNKRR